MAGRRVVYALIERRRVIAPGLAAVETVGEAAVVEASPLVVLTGDQVGRVGRINLDLLLGLEPEAAVLVDADVALVCAPAAAERVVVEPRNGGCIIGGHVRRRRAETREITFGGECATGDHRHRASDPAWRLQHGGTQPPGRRSLDDALSRTNALRQCDEREQQPADRQEPPPTPLC